MVTPAHTLMPADSILEKLETCIPGSRAEILTRAQNIEDARQVHDKTLTQHFLRFCSGAKRDLYTSMIMSPGPYGMGVVNHMSIKHYNETVEQNAMDDAAEKTLRPADSLRYAIVTYMRDNGLHGSLLGMSAEESASLKMAYPQDCPKLAKLAPQ